MSIGVPVYNGARFIARTLDALLAQTFEDVEIIVCDNASTDATATIVASYMARDARIRYARNEQNRGAIYNYHRVLSLASGAYFKWMASDDIVRHDFLAAAVAELDARPEVVLAYSKAAFIDEDDRVLYRFDDVMQLGEWPSGVVARSNKALRAIFRDGSAANVIIFGLARTSALRTIRPLGNYFGCDFVAVTELALLGEIAELPAVMSFYRRHAASSSTYEGTPSAAVQQQFYDPSVTGRLRQELHLRRRYVEVFRAIARADLPIRRRVLVSFGAVASIGRRVAWRLRFEMRSALGGFQVAEGTDSEGVGRHWEELVTSGETERERYHKNIATLDPDHPWHRLSEHVPLGAEVLDVGCGSGELGSFLASRSAAIDGVEPNPDRAQNARRYLRTVVTGAAGPSANSSLRSDYDVIVFADVLEHIAETEDILRWAATRLSANGRIVALIPNSANWMFRRRMLKGDWSYADTGYFDRDHVRFFDTRTARELGRRAGLPEIALEYVPGRLPKPLATWSRGASLATGLRPNLFAGHVLAIWGRPASGADAEDQARPGP